MAELDAVESAEGLRAANAAAHGQALAEAGKDAGVQRWTDAIHARAFPEVHVPFTPAAARGASPFPGAGPEGPLTFAPPEGAVLADPGPDAPTR